MGDLETRYAREVDMLTFELPANGNAPGLARARLRASLVLDAETAADLELLLSEVVSNAVKHAGMAPTEDIVVRIQPNEAIHVEVLDSGAGFNPVRNPITRSPRGWGLSLLDRLARDWRVERDGERTKVWFEIARRGREARASAA